MGQPPVSPAGRLSFSGTGMPVPSQEGSPWASLSLLSVSFCLSAFLSLFQEDSNGHGLSSLGYQG